MTICLSDAGKRYNRDWIFRHLSVTFEPGQRYAITGPNGSGKSTLLQVLGGSMLTSEGRIEWKHDSKKVGPEDIYRQISFCAPYLELIEEMTLREFLRFHQSFKPFVSGMDTETAIDRVGLGKAAGKQIRYFSSGMKQRAKLAQCLFSDTPVVLLDEPCTNLDRSGIELYHELVSRYCPGRLVIVSSNDEVEYRFCTERLDISRWKQVIPA